MNRKNFLKHNRGYLIGLIVALFVVAALLLGRAGLLGGFASKLTGNSSSGSRSILRSWQRIAPASASMDSLLRASNICRSFAWHGLCIGMVRAKLLQYPVKRICPAQEPPLTIEIYDLRRVSTVTYAKLLLIGKQP